MKRLVVLLFGLVGAALFMSAANSGDRVLRDSIFHVYRSMPADTTRTVFAKEAAMGHVKESWALELLDSALVFAREIKDVEGELELQYGIFRYYTFRMDGENMEKTCATLREACYRYKKYDNYFLALHYVLQLKGSEGDTEYAILESRKMREEAVRLHVDRGVFLSYITEGKSYVFARNTEKAIEQYLKALEIEGTTFGDKLMVHGYLASSYYLKDKYKEALGELKAQRQLIDGVIKKKPSMLGVYRSTLLTIELMYCKIYLGMVDADPLWIHLNEAAKFYDDDCFSATAVNYHFSWAGYYYLRQDWERCFPEFERTLAAFKGTQPMYEIEIRRIMGDAYVDAGRYEEAARTYKTAAVMCDSVNKATLRMNEETVEANYRIRKALLDKELGEKRFLQVAVVGLSLFVVLLVWGVIRLIRIRGELVKSQKEMAESYAVVVATDKMKEVFLRNITDEIRVPLDTVVELSDRLCRETNLKQEKQQEYSATIKKCASKLIGLIFNVLDLARLESGMMKFVVEEYDVVQLCTDARLMVEMQTENRTKVDFHTEPDMLLIDVDTNRFMKMLASVLKYPEESEGLFRVKFILSRPSEDYLQIKVVNSPIFMTAESEKEFDVLHTINRLYLETFQGSYQLLEKSGERMIVITYPVS